MRIPSLIVNFKTYRQGTGKAAVRLAKACERVARQTKTTIAVAVQASDISRVAKAVSIPVFCQHIDNISYGSNTGHILAEAVREAGAAGTLLNHSERHLPLDLIGEIIRANKRKLCIIACAPTAEIAGYIAHFSPHAIAVEPPELIGGNVSVSSARPGLITESIRQVHAAARIPVLIGAGIHTTKDVAVGRGLGAAGILLASAVVTAQKPERILRELARGLA
ncbi:MAG TPA: triose-phosphate isomerase [Candidatus Nanoarchaeia archaeon]|nr:triose-phosphate isomerase [Candidatus Nanoarchaeia archaeon]